MTHDNMLVLWWVTEISLTVWYVSWNRVMERRLLTWHTNAARYSEHIPERLREEERNRTGSDNKDTLKIDGLWLHSSLAEKWKQKPKQWNTVVESQASELDRTKSKFLLSRLESGMTLTNLLTSWSFDFLLKTSTNPGGGNPTVLMRTLGCR